MGNSSNRDTRAAEAREVENQALELRKRGYNYRQVAKALSISVGTAHKYIQRAIDRIPAENAEQVRNLELERIDKMLTGVWERATKGDTKAILATVRLMERRARYLGLDAPEKHDVGVKAVGPALFIPIERSDDDDTAASSPGGLAPESGAPN